VSFETAVQPLLDCLCDALGAAGWEGECCLNPGQPSLEMCCEGGGMAWGYLVRAYPSSSFPAEDFGASSQTNCAGPTQWALVVELGASECVCDDMCSCAQKAENATRVLAHAEAGLRGLICCFSDAGPCSGLEYRIGGAETGGPEGNCAAFKIEVTVQYSMGCGCPDES
jgi:hypothetical protein